MVIDLKSASDQEIKKIADMLLNIETEDCEQIIAPLKQSLGAKAFREWNLDLFHVIFSQQGITKSQLAKKTKRDYAVVHRIIGRYKEMGLVVEKPIDKKSKGLFVSCPDTNQPLMLMVAKETTKQINERLKDKDIAQIRKELLKAEKISKQS